MNGRAVYQKLLTLQGQVCWNYFDKVQLQVQFLSHSVGL